MRMRTRSMCACVSVPSSCVCVGVYMCVCVCVYVCMYVCMYVLIRNSAKRRANYSSVRRRHYQNFTLLTAYRAVCVCVCVCVCVYIYIYIYIYIYKGVKWSRYRPGVAQRVGRDIALLFHDRGTRRGWVVSSTPRPHFTPGKTQYPFYRRLGGPQGRSGRAESLVPIGIRSRTVQPVQSVAILTELRGPCIYIYIYIYIFGNNFNNPKFYSGRNKE